MSRVVFLVEERSMAAFLQIWVARAFPGVPFHCVPHQGKADLLKSISRKLRAWREPAARFVIVIDNDRRDCEELKAQLLRICRDAGRDDALIRIACQELEAWYLGDPEALAAAFADPTLPDRLKKPRFRNPDTLAKPSGELARLVPAFQKVSGARAVARYITRERSTSASFMTFVAGIDRIVGCLPPLPNASD